MTQEDKLLLQDLCARLPYGVKAQYYGSEEEMLIVDIIEAIYTQPPVEIVIGQYGLEIKDIKPYLRPMSSMTDEEKSQYNFYLTRIVFGYDASLLIDYLNKKMFDYRGLIPKGLALEAPEGMYENKSDSMTDNTTQITVGCKIRSKTNPDVILSIISDDCHGDEFGCSNSSVLSLRQINKHYDLYIEENKGTIIIN